MTGEERMDVHNAAESVGAQLRVRSRLTELRHQLELGERQLVELTAQETALRETLLRISGAITVLEELLQPEAVNGVATGAATTGRGSP